MQRIERMRIVSMKKFGVGSVREMCFLNQEYLGLDLGIVGKSFFPLNWGIKPFDVMGDAFNSHCHNTNVLPSEKWGPGEIWE